MSYQRWISFILITLLVDLSPGPAVMLAVGTTISKGLKDGVKSIIGLQTGELIWASVAVVAIIFSYRLSDRLLDVLEFVGSIYLIYIGLQSAFGMPSIFSLYGLKKESFGRRVKKEKLLSPFWTGIATQLANPKSYLYWLAFLPQFQPSGGPTLEFNLWLVAAANFTTVPVLLIYAYIADRTRRSFDQENRRHVFDRLSGCVLIILGIWMLVQHLKETG